ncbi:MAG: glycosyltransferase family 4 protein [Chloroflexi bacterium]|nr:glycosyltransferase family 4 protein [Chloroflexota bacterium]
MAGAGKHIGLDAHLLSLRQDYRAAGVSRYIDRLLRHLPDVEPTHRYTAFLGFPCAGLPPRVRPWVSAWPTQRPAARILWEQLAGPLAARRAGLDLWHSLVNVLPLALAGPAVVTIQDLSFVVYPERFRTGNRLYNRLFVRLSAQRARHVIVTSASTQRDLVQHYRLPEAKISVTHLAADEDFRPLEDRAAVAEFRRVKGLPDRLILYVGTIEPRKNLPRLIEAYGQLCRGEGIPHHLVIGGGKGWMYDQVYARVQELGLQDRVHFPGFIPQEELVWWYNAAEIMAYPSLYEGFGLPPLEAMACGTPAVVSRISSLPEIVGDAALQVDPYDVGELAEALHRLAGEAALRADQRAAGLARAAQFSWPRTAQQTVAIYHRLFDDERSGHV